MFLLFVLPIVAAFSVPHRHDSHEHSVQRRLPGTWFHPENHPVHALFRRDSSGTNASAFGTPAWAAQYPSPTAAPDSTQLPQQWVDALDAAVAAGTIPNIPQSSGTPDTNPVYPDGNDPTGSTICSATYKCRNPGDYWDAPDGHFGVGFDDGPTPATPGLLQFLQTYNQTATHFMIGAQIIWYPQQFLQAFNAGDDIAVHTWSHPHMTTLSNLDLVAQFGWTMKLIYDSTGGRVPKFWRPPYGDSDNRVRAIAKEIFGLETIIWNNDSEDWQIGNSPDVTLQTVNTSLTQWITGPKSPGLIILEHEISDTTVAAFLSAFPLVKQYGWQTVSVTRLVDGPSAFWNAPSSSGPVSQADFLEFGANTVTPATAGATSQTAVSSATSSSAATSTPNQNNKSNQNSNSGLRSTQLGARVAAWTILLTTLSWLVL